MSILSSMKKLRDCFSVEKGNTLVELLLAIAVSSIILPVLLTGFVASREGKSQQKQRLEAISVMEEMQEAIRNVRESGWGSFSTNGTFHPQIFGSAWVLASGAQTINGFTRQAVISDVYRDATGVIVATGAGTLDPSTKKVDLSVIWTQPYGSSITSSFYLTRYLDNLTYLQTTLADFNGDTKTQVKVVNNSGGEVTLGDNNKAKWCSPAFSTSTIDLPDGPPVAVSATASATTTLPNDVFVATAPYATSSVKLAYVNVTANEDPPVSTVRGTFTLDSSKYSSPGLVPTGIGIDNNFKTNDVRYYKSPGGKMYALLATDMPGHEVIAVQVHDGVTNTFQDPVNKIYTYWTYFNTRRYQGNTQALPNQDQAPWGYGVTSISVLGTQGYVSSGGYLYVFDLSNIDSKSPNNGLDMVGCRIELDGYDCRPNPASDKKYSAGQTGTNYSNIGWPVHNDCSDGGNIELYATNDIFPVQVGGNTYVFVAVGAGTNPEFDIANVTNVPSSSTSPRINYNSCGTISGGNSGWKRISTYDFNSNPRTEEAANSVFAKSDGTRAYISSNGGIDGDGNGQPDSKQFYVLDTSNKFAPMFLSGNPFSGPGSGYYYGTDPNDDLFPRRSLTVLNGQRAVLVGKDGFLVNAKNPKDYQVLDITTEATPNFCAGLDFDSGFNDLTSVTEADLDNYVYMVANTNEKQLKIIQGGPDGKYFDSGTIESSTFDVGYTTAFNRISANFTTPSNTSVQFQFASADAVSGSCNGVTFNFLGPDGTSNTYYPGIGSGSALLLNDDGVGYENPGRCFRYKAFLSTTDYNTTPTLSDVTINYSP